MRKNTSIVEGCQEEFPLNEGYEYIAIVTRNFRKAIIGKDNRQHDAILSSNFRSIKRLFASRSTSTNSINHVQINSRNHTTLLIFISSFRLPVYIYAVINNNLDADVALGKIRFAITQFLKEESIYDFLLENMLDRSLLSKAGTAQQHSTEMSEEELPPFMRTDSVLRMLNLRTP